MEVKTLETISKNAPFAIIGVGLFMIFSSFTGGFTKYFIVPPERETGLLIAGVVVGAVGGFMYWFEKYRQPKKVNYGIKIHSPLSGVLIKSPIQATGTYKILPKSENIYSMEYNTTTELYWPKGRVVFDPNSKTWSAQLGIGGGDNKPRRLIIAELSEGGFALYEYYKLVRDAGTHKGIPKFNSVIRILDQVNIMLEKP